jgi:hypothetical protein
MAPTNPLNTIPGPNHIKLTVLYPHHIDFQTLQPGVQNTITIELTVILFHQIETESDHYTTYTFACPPNLPSNGNPIPGSWLNRKLPFFFCISSVKGSSNVSDENSSYGFTCTSNTLHVSDTLCNKTQAVQNFECKSKQHAITSGLKEIIKHIRSNNTATGLSLYEQTHEIKIVLFSSQVFSLECNTLSVSL